MKTREKTLDYYMSLPYTIEVKHDPESEWAWFARVVELPGCMTEAPTFEELGPMIEDAMRSWIEVGLEHGDPIPEPRNTKDYSGNVRLRMPKSLHRDLVRMAEGESVSLNQLMVTILAQAAGRAEWSSGSAELPTDLALQVRWFYEQMMQHLNQTVHQQTQRERQKS
jgi:antitoxin HicB